MENRQNDAHVIELDRTSSHVRSHIQTIWNTLLESEALINSELVHDEESCDNVCRFIQKSI